MRQQLTAHPRKADLPSEEATPNTLGRAYHTLLWKLQSTSGNGSMTCELLFNMWQPTCQELHGMRSATGRASDKVSVSYENSRD